MITGKIVYRIEATLVFIETFQTYSFAQHTEKLFEVQGILIIVQYLLFRVLFFLDINYSDF